MQTVESHDSAWWYLCDGDDVPLGPISPFNVPSLVAAAQLGPSTLVAADPAAAPDLWHPLRSVPSLAAYLADSDPPLLAAHAAPAPASPPVDGSALPNAAAAPAAPLERAESPATAAAGGEVGEARERGGEESCAESVHANDNLNHFGVDDGGGEEGEPDDGAEQADARVASARERKRQSRKRARRAAAQRARANTSVYVRGVPADASTRELAAHFAKCGILQPDGVTGRPRVKLYARVKRRVGRDVGDDGSTAKMEKGKGEGGEAEKDEKKKEKEEKDIDTRKKDNDEEGDDCAGDVDNSDGDGDTVAALVTYALRPSVANALALLDGAPLRPGGRPLLVSEATFDHKRVAPAAPPSAPPSTGAHSTTTNITTASAAATNDTPQHQHQNQPRAKRARAAGAASARSIVEEALSWEESAATRHAASRIVVLKNAFDGRDVSVDYETVRADMEEGCGQCGPLEKVTVFERNAEGVVAARFATAAAAVRCIEVMDDRWYDGRRLAARLYDGADYRYKETEGERRKRDREWREWLEAGGERDTAAEGSALGG